MKRLIALFLSLTMLLSLCPINIWAEELTAKDQQVYIAEDTSADDLSGDDSAVESESQTEDAQNSTDDEVVVEDSSAYAPSEEEETPSEGEDETAENGEAEFDFESITISTPVANAAATVEARWGLATGTNSDQKPASWVGSGTLVQAMTYANGRSSGEVAYIQLQSDVSNGSRIMVNTGKAMVLDLNGNDINRGLKSASSTGEVIRVQGNLTICDTSSTASSAPGKITGGYCTTDGGGISVVGGTLTLKNGEISGNKTSASVGGVYVISSTTTSGTTYGNFTMKGGSISNNSGAGVLVGAKSTFTMDGGTISGNNGIGVTVTAVGTKFILNNGTISGNKNGGVRLVGGTFTMNDGKITGNTSLTDGGGVYVAIGNGGTFTMNAGTISGNTAARWGGGVYYNSEYGFIMNGGEISGNTADTAGGGIHYVGTGFSVSGKAKIIDNKVGTADNNVNQYYNSRRISVGTLSPGAKIGVTLADGTGTFSTGGAAYANSDYFFSDNDAYAVYDDGDNLKLAAAPATVTVTFNANGGSGTMSSMTVHYNAATILKANTFTRTGYAFTGWNTAADGSGTAYADKAIITTKKAVTLYAQWKDTHSHPTCGVVGCTADHGHSTVSTWTKLTSVGTSLGSGNYYLGQDITVNSTISISGTVNLCLNGNTLSLASGKIGSVISVPAGATLNLCDCSDPSTGKITGGNTTIEGGGIYVFGNLVMYGGTISGNYSDVEGGGVFVNGGGGANIASFKMYGGSIVNNSAKHHAGGVYLSNCTATLSGTPVISGNTSGDGSFSYPVKADNMYVYAYMSNGSYVPNASVTVGSLTDGASIGVGLTSPCTFASGGADYADKFFSDNTSYEVVVDGENLALAEPTRYATVTFHANGGGGNMEPQTVVSGMDVTLNSNAFTRQGYVFNGWNTKSDGTGTTVPDKATFLLQSDVAFYAQWKHSHLSCGVEDCTADHGHSTVDTWTELTKDDLDNGKLILTDGNSYYLGEDITVTNGAIINGTVNLCLNGKTLKNESGKAVDLNYSASVVVCDCSGNNAGTISGGSVGIWANMSNTKVTLYGGLVSGGTGISLSSSASYSTLTVYGGVVTATKHWGIEQGGIHSTVTVNGGSISGTHGIYSPNMYDGDGISSYNEIHVNGGTITGTTSCGVFAECDVYVSGGTLNGNTYGLSISDDLHTIYLSGAPAISGTTGGIELDGSTITVADTLTNTTPIGITMTNLGTFAKPDGTNVTTLSEYVGKFASDNAASTVVVDGTDLKLVQNEARWGLAVDGKAPTTWVGGGTFIDAVTYANTLQSGTAYIQLLSNVNTTYGISFVSGKTTILDLNGHTIDRGLTTGSNANSEVMGGYVLNAVGNLTLCDSSSSDVSKQGKITGGKNASSYGVENRTNCGGGVHVSSSGTFTLAGGNIEGNVAKQGGGVFSLGSFTMTGGAISGNSATYRGGGVCVQEGAFTMSGGTISDNTTKEGAGVDITNGSFTLSGGFISDNTASLYGGGVQGGPFIMTGGTISGNKADQGGGGVDVTASNTFTMEGGTISDNSASWGAGVNLPANGTFIMSGGTITGNTANDHAGVNAAGSFELSGSPVIIGNTIGTGNEAIASNVYQNGDRIVVGILTAGAAIGVSRSSGIGTFTTGGGNYAAYFTSDNADYIVANDGKGNLMLAQMLDITFIPNGGSGTMDDQSIFSGVAATLKANTFTREGYSFIGWNTASNGSGLSYSDGASVTLVSATTLYAQWELNEARWGYACTDTTTSGSHFCLANWVGTGTLSDAIAFANGLNPNNTIQPEKAYIELLTDIDTSAPLEFASGTITVLDLKGHTINRGLTEATVDGNVITVNGSLILCDTSDSALGKITGGYNTVSGGGVIVSNSGTLAMNGGSITENTAANTGGGVWCQGVFTMNDGTISQNVADNGKGDTGSGGGVSCSGTFTMNGGLITANNAFYHGGGVYAQTGSTFTMYGGTISGNIGRYGGGVWSGAVLSLNHGSIIGNKSTENGGGVQISNGTATVGSIVISGNTAAKYGGGIYANHTLTLSGAPNLSGNMLNGSLNSTTGLYENGEANNIYLCANRVINIGTLTSDTSIGVIMANGTGTFTSGGEDYAAYFTSDDPDYIVARDGNGNLMLVYPTLTGVVAEGFSGSYDGKAHGITVTAPDGATVKYGTTEGTYDKIESPTITNAGDLIVYYQVTKEGYIPATGSAKVSITKATASCTAPVAVEELIYSGTPQTLITPADTDCGTVQYMGENGAFSSSLPTRTNAGTYYVYYKVIGDVNHNDTGVLGPVEVKMDKAPLTIIAKNHTITYGDAPANNGVDYSGFVNGETSSALGGTLSYSHSYEQYGNVGEYTITPSGLSSNNYEISYTKGTLTVEQKEIGIMWDNTDLTYNGKEQSPTATATGTVNGDALTLTVDGAQSSASTTGYTATVKGISGDKAGNYKLPGNVVTTFTIAKATPALGNVSVVGTVKDTTDPTVVVLTGTNTTVDGTFALTDEKLLANVTTYHWTFTPTDTANYNVVTGKVEIDVLDTVAPSVVVTVEENQWRTTLNTITFGLFFKETKTVTIDYADNENGSGIDEMLYYVSDKAVADVANIPWETYSKSFNIDPDGTFVIYAKAVDKDGNSAMVNSDGIVVDATAPLLKDIVDGGIYYGDLTITAYDALAGVSTVTVDGNTVVLENGQYTLAADNSEHTVVVTDKAGNTQQYTVHVMKMYTVSFIVDGEILDTVTVGHGQSIGLPMIPDKAGYDQFPPYWNHNGKNITKDTEITAIYIINKYTVSGTVTSYLEADETVTIGLYVDDSTVAKYATVVTGNTVAYAIANVDFGTYTMKVSKENHVTREYTVVVDDHVTWNAEICPKGDVNLDGEVNADDLTALARHVAKIESLTDPYALLTANVDNNDMLSADDLTLLARFVAKIIPSL